MGVDYDSKLIIGIQINYQSIVNFLIQNKIGTCLKENYDDPKFKLSDQCFCGDDCWKLKDKLIPENLYIIRTSPYYDCKDNECMYFISLVDREIPLNKCLEIINNKTLQKTLIDFININKFTNYKVDENSIMILSTTNIW
jgi:hypothetical protein